VELERLQSFFLQVDVAEIVLHKADQPSCAAGMMRIALKERAEAKARYEEKLAEQKRVEEVEAELKKIQAEEKRIKALRRDAVAWHRAERLRR
jgi:hypothetical protein